jgi:predicted metalloendopeptidase
MTHMLRLTPFLVLLSIGPASRSFADTIGPNRAFMDTTCSPCRDFYQYANGVWQKQATIPAAYTAIGASREMNDRNQMTLKRVLDGAAAGADREQDPTLQKLGWLYAVLMDSARAEREGLAPLKDELARIDAIGARADVMATFARGTTAGTFTPLNLRPESDPDHSSMNIAQLWQGGLGLPERDYYFRTDPRSDTLRREYVAHVARVFVLLGVAAEQARADADRVMGLETALAESSLSAVELRDPKRLYNRRTVGELGALAPAFDWPAYFRAAGVPALAAPTAELDVSMTGFVRQLGRLVEERPVEDWKAYLRYHRVRGALGWLDQAAFDEMFRFTSRLSGQKVPQPRWKRVLPVVDGAMGEALGKAYVATEFPPSSKVRMLEMIENIKAALKERIESRPWMSAETKREALKKFGTIVQKIGYPDTWRDYSALQIDPKLPALANLRSAQAFDQARELAKIGKPKDRAEWYMTPPTVNAYYSAQENEIAFPAGILQPPYFDPRVDDAVNYGAIGLVIGHELTHGFDDEGRQWDADGNLREWWQKEDSERFDALARRYVDQYGGYLGVDTLHVNGKLTLGENIGDHGGLTVAYAAWQRSLRGKPAPPSIDGFTPEQRFFLGFGQMWRRKFRPETMRMIVLTDPHSPYNWRVNGTVANSPEFAQAFGCKAGDPMVRDESVRAGIW